MRYGIKITNDLILRFSVDICHSNAWPPLQEIVVTGLEKSGYGPAKELALNIVKRWVKNGYLAYTETKEHSGKSIFFEKYDTNKVRNST